MAMGVLSLQGLSPAGTLPRVRVHAQWALGAGLGAGKCAPCWSSLFGDLEQPASTGPPDCLAALELVMFRILLEITRPLAAQPLCWVNKWKVFQRAEESYQSLVPVPLLSDGSVCVWGAGPGGW